MPDVLEVVVRHRRCRRRRELRQRQRAHASVIADVADVGCRGLFRTVAGDEVFVARVVGFASEGTGTTALDAPDGDESEREATRDWIADGIVADVRLLDETTLQAACLDARPVDRVAVLDGRIVGNGFGEARAIRIRHDRIPGRDATANDHVLAGNRIREAVVRLVPGLDAIGHAVLGERATVEIGDETRAANQIRHGIVVDAARAAPAELVDAPHRLFLVRGPDEADSHARSDHGTVGEDIGLRIAVGAFVRVVRPLAGALDEARPARSAAHRAALERAVPRARAEPGLLGGGIHHVAAQERVAPDRVVRRIRLLVVVEAALEVVPPRGGGAVDEERAVGGDAPREAAGGEAVDVGLVGLGVDDGDGVDGHGRRAVREGLRAGRQADESAEAAVGHRRFHRGRAAVEGGAPVRHAGRAAGGRRPAVESDRGRAG